MTVVVTISQYHMCPTANGSVNTVLSSQVMNSKSTADLLLYVWGGYTFDFHNFQFEIAQAYKNLKSEKVTCGELTVLPEADLLVICLMLQKLVSSTRMNKMWFIV